MVSEVFPLRTRGRALSVAVLVNFASNALVTFAFAPIQVKCALSTMVIMIKKEHNLKPSDHFR